MTPHQINLLEAGAALVAVPAALTFFGVLFLVVAYKIGSKS